MMHKGRNAIRLRSERGRWTIGALLMVLLAGCGISPRIETVAPQGGNIVFTSSRAVDGTDAANSVTNIWTINPDGSGSRALTSLTAAGASSASPAWSPDGSKIAYESFRALDGSNASIPAVNIWVMNADGSGNTPLTRLTAQPVSSIHSAWSPDGSKIAFDSTRALDGTNSAIGVPNVWVVKSDGSGAVPLTKLTAAMASSVLPAWSPDGTMIAFVSARALDGTNSPIAVRNVWIMNSDGSNQHPLTQLTAAGSSDIAWSPDGARIAFVSTRSLDGTDTAGNAANLWVMNADGSGATPLTHLTNLYNMTTEAPEWSPDGKRILYVSSRALDGSDNGGSVMNIWTMNADGSGSKPLTTLSAATNYQPSWSSDGGRVVFCATRALDGSDAPNANATWNLWMMNSDGTGQHALTKNTSYGSDSAGPQWLR